MGTPEFVTGWSEVCVGGGSGSYQLVSEGSTVLYVCACGRKFDITPGSQHRNCIAEEKAESLTPP